MKNLAKILLLAGALASLPAVSNAQAKEEKKKSLAKQRYLLFLVFIKFQMNNATEEAEGTAHIYEKTTISLNNYTYYKSIENKSLKNTESSSEFGFGLFAGWETLLFKNTKIFIEGVVRTAPNDLGGMTLKAGIRESL